MLNDILDLIMRQIFGQPFMLMAIIVFVGYMAMKEKVGKALMGAAKAAIGLLVMGMGSGALIANFNKLLSALTTSTGIQGAGLNTYPTMTASYEKMDAVLGAGTGASWGIYTLLFAFIINIILVFFRKYTKIRSVYLTGNAMIVQAGISVYIVWRFLGSALSPVMVILIASLITALYWGIFSTLLIKPTEAVTGAEFTVAHQQMLVSYVAYKVAPKIGNAEKDDIEQKQMSNKLSFMQDNVIATFLVMFISAAAIFLVIGGDGIEALRVGDGGFAQGTLSNPIIFLLWIALTLTANMYVLLAGVRMFVGEIMVSFKGISERLLPGAVAGVDCAAIFAFAPKSVVLGLMFGALGQIIGLLLLVVFRSPIFLVPGFIPLFFDNATIAIFSNKAGGWKAAAIICTINGIIQILGSAIAINWMQLTWWQGSADYATLWVGVIAFFKFLGQALGIPIAG